MFLSKPKIYSRKQSLVSYRIIKLEAVNDGNHVLKSIFLADDDSDDCLLFEDALREVCRQTCLNVSNDGDVLMQRLHQTILSDAHIVFLDLNMPRKNGFECLEEIRQSDRLKSVPVIVFSTTSQEQSVYKAYEKGANLYIRKPSTFGGLKAVIQKVLRMNWKEKFLEKPSLEAFVVSI